MEVMSAEGCFDESGSHPSSQREGGTDRFFQKAFSRLARISDTRRIALTVVWTRSRSYRTGTLRRFWNSNVES
jgi:hypothetical protein